MKIVQISLQKVVAILRNNVLFRNFKTGRQHEILLKTGAKLVKNEGKYYISGYHYAGEDVDYYFKKRK